MLEVITGGQVTQGDEVAQGILRLIDKGEAGHLIGLSIHFGRPDLPCSQLRRREIQLPPQRP